MSKELKDEWLIAENVQGDREYIIHCHHPKFIAKISSDDLFGEVAEVVEWWDTPPQNVMAVARLMRRAGEALKTYDEILEEENEQ